MFPIKRKREGADGNPLIQKKNVAQNPLQLEPTIEELQPVQSVLDQKLKEWVNVQYEQILQEPILPEQKIARLHALEFHAGMNKITEFMTNTKKQFVLDFIKWLQYKDPIDPLNEAFVRETERQLGELGATVRNGPLDVEGKEEWLCNFINKKVKYDRAILKLRLGPHSTHNWDLHDAWLYYKYILRGEKLPQNDFLSDFDEYFYHKMNPPTLPQQDIKLEPQEPEFVPGHHPPGKLPQDAKMEAVEHREQEEEKEEAQKQHPVGAPAVPQKPVPDVPTAQLNDTLNQILDAVREDRSRKKRTRPAEGKEEPNGEEESKRPKPAKEEPEEKQREMEAEDTGPPQVQPVPTPPLPPAQPAPRAESEQTEPPPENPKAEEDAAKKKELRRLWVLVRNAKDRARNRAGNDKDKRHADKEVLAAMKEMGDYAADNFLMSYKDAKDFLNVRKNKPPKDKGVSTTTSTTAIRPPQTEKEKNKLTTLKSKAQDKLGKIAKSRPDAQNEIAAAREQVASATTDVDVLKFTDTIPLLEQKLENKDTLIKALDAKDISSELKDQAVAEFSAVPPPEATIDMANQIVNTLLQQKNEKRMEVDKPEESDSVKDNEGKMEEIERPNLSNMSNIFAAQKNKLKAASTSLRPKPKDSVINILGSAMDRRRKAFVMDERDDREKDNADWEDDWEDDQPFDASKIINTTTDKEGKKNKDKKQDKKEKPVKEKAERKKREKEEKEAREKEEEERLATLKNEYAPLLNAAKDRKEFNSIMDEFNKKAKEQPGQESFKEVQKAKLKEFEDQEKAAEKKRLEDVEQQFRPLMENAKSEEEVNKIYAEYEKAKASKEETQQSIEDLRKAKLKEFEERKRQEKRAEKEKHEEEARIQAENQQKDIILGEFGERAATEFGTLGITPNDEYPKWYTEMYKVLMRGRSEDSVARFQQRAEDMKPKFFEKIEIEKQNQQAAREKQEEEARIAAEAQNKMDEDDAAEKARIQRANKRKEIEPLESARPDRIKPKKTSSTKKRKP